eukprot:GHVP01068906.1.p1 GENE.GHVP01068906.1~~GHVP01068906.1.p1  ORF type:complete len:623 (+),score=116.40 GHVP01068906.1:4335-6203(+)
MESPYEVSDSIPSQAVIFKDRIRVFRTAKISTKDLDIIPNCTRQLKISRLPIQILDRNVRVSCKEALVGEVSVDHELIHAEKAAKTKEVKEGLQKLKDLEKKQAALESKKKAALSAKSYFEEFFRSLFLGPRYCLLRNVETEVQAKQEPKNASSEICPPTYPHIWPPMEKRLHDGISVAPTVANLSNIDAERTTILKSYLDDICKLDHEIQDVKEEIKLLLAQEGYRQRPDSKLINRILDSFNPTSMNYALVTLTFPEAIPETIEVELDYFGAGANWDPVYDVRLLGNQSDELEIRLGAIVRQTLENFTDVKISFSNSLSSDGTPPFLEVVDLSFEQPPEKSPDKNKKNFLAPQPRGSGPQVCPEESEAQRLNTMANNAPKAADLDARIKTLGLTSSALFTFDVDKKFTIKNTYQPIKIPISTFKVSCSLMRLIVPALTQRCYLVAKIQNSLPFTLPASKEVNVYKGVSYLTRTSMEAISSESEGILHLGIDSDVKVFTAKLRKSREEHGFFTKTAALKYEQSTIITNAVNEPKSLAVIWNLPHSKDTKISIKLLTPSFDESFSEASDEGLAFQQKKRKSHHVFNKATESVIHLTPLDGNSNITSNFSYRVEFPSELQITSE